MESLPVETVHRIQMERLAKNLDKVSRAFVQKNYAKLKATRRAIGYDQEYVAQLAKSNRQYIVHIENGRTRGISAEAVQRILEVYWKLEELYERAHGTSDKGGKEDVERP